MYIREKSKDKKVFRVLAKIHFFIDVKLNYPLTSIKKVSMIDCTSGETAAIS